MVTIIKTVADVAQATGEIQAGATDVQARRRRGISSGPLVDIHHLDELKEVDVADDGGVTIGALVKIDTVATHDHISQHYGGLAQAAGGLATPQIRWMGSMGGALLQKTRCHFYRHPAYSCYKKGGDSCPAREGHNPNGVVFDMGPCVYPHPSTLGMALMAYEAQVTIQGQARQPVAALYGDGSDPSRDHMLTAGQILTHIHLPAPVAAERSAYFRAISRFEAEWPIVECLARFVVRDGVIARARIGVGGVAPIPLRLENVEQALMGQSVTQAAVVEAVQRAAEATEPLPQTAWKVKLLVNTVLETAERALGL